MSTAETLKASQPEASLPEPWLRGTHTEIAPVLRAVLHALELAREDLTKWCGNLSDEELNARPAGLAPVAFHLRHIARSTDRLLAYAEGSQLSAEQITAMKGELAPGATHDDLFKELTTALEHSATRIRNFDQAQLTMARKVGKKELPTTVAGLLVHVADHMQRHVGQAITTAKVVNSH